MSTGGNAEEALQKSGEAADRDFSTREAGHTVEGCGQPAWIEIQLVGEDARPIPNARFRVELPDGTVKEGTTDAEGVAGFEGIPAGDCKVSFPDLDAEAWEPHPG